jgi:hypothetical protein
MALRLSLHTLNVVLHVLAGACALAVGSIPLFTSKGGRLHRRAGRIFVAIAAVVLATATVADLFFDPPGPLIAASLAAGYQYLSSLRALRLRDRGPGWPDALLALAGLAGCAALFMLMGPGTTSWTPAVGYSTIGYVAFLAGYDLSRHFWRSAWLAHVRLLDHGLKMTGAYFAMMSAGVGNIFRDLQPWSQVGPSALGFMVMIVLTIAYARRGAERWRPRAAAANV